MRIDYGFEAVNKIVETSCFFSERAVNRDNFGKVRLLLLPNIHNPHTRRWRGRISTISDDHSQSVSVRVRHSQKACGMGGMLCLCGCHKTCKRCSCGIK